MSERVGKNVPLLLTICAFKTWIRLSKLVFDGFITMGHGRAIINIEDLTNRAHQKKFKSEPFHL
jgi:hypothetical protein